jgi:hypothetical protein
MIDHASSATRNRLFGSMEIETRANQGKQLERRNFDRCQCLPRNNCHRTPPEKTYTERAFGKSEADLIQKDPVT